MLNEGSLTVGFDTTVTEELLQEGIARDIVRSVQNLRKDSGFDVSDRIRLTYYGDEVCRGFLGTWNLYSTGDIVELRNVCYTGKR